MEKAAELSKLKRKGWGMRLIRVLEEGKGGGGGPLRKAKGRKTRALENPLKVNKKTHLGPTSKKKKKNPIMPTLQSRKKGKKKIRTHCILGQGGKKKKRGQRCAVYPKPMKREEGGGETDRSRPAYLTKKVSRLS